MTHQLQCRQEQPSAAVPVSPWSVETSRALSTQANTLTLPEQKRQDPHFGLPCCLFSLHLCCTLLGHFYENKTAHGFISLWRWKKEETGRYIFLSHIWGSRCWGCSLSILTAEIRSSCLWQPTLGPYHEQHSAVFSIVTGVLGEDISQSELAMT